LRYLFAEKTESGRTHLLAVWTDGPFNMYALFPNTPGDTPGTDPKDAPRPPNSVRVLTADVEGTPYGVRVYDSTSKPEEVAAAYDAQMGGRGWTPILYDAEDPAGARVYTRPGSKLMVFTETNAGHTVVSLVDMSVR